MDNRDDDPEVQEARAALMRRLDKQIASDIAAENAASRAAEIGAVFRPV